MRLFLTKVGNILSKNPDKQGENRLNTAKTANLLLIFLEHRQAGRRRDGGGTAAGVAGRRH